MINHPTRLLILNTQVEYVSPARKIIEESSGETGPEIQNGPDHGGRSSPRIIAHLPSLLPAQSATFYMAASREGALPSSFRYSRSTKTDPTIFYR